MSNKGFALFEGSRERSWALIKGRWERTKGVLCSRAPKRRWVLIKGRRETYSVLCSEGCALFEGSGRLIVYFVRGLQKLETYNVLCLRAPKTGDL